MFIALLISTLCVLAFMVWASASVRSGIYLRVKCRGDRSVRAVALTFDDGPHPELTPRVLDVLKEHGVRAAFFVKGECVQRHPDIVRRIAEEGHLIGNHSYRHRGSFPLTGTKGVVRELESCERAVEAACGVKPEYFRPPFGITNPDIGRAVRQKGLITIGWSIRSFDTLGRNRERTVTRVVKRLCNGAVILLHDDREGCPELTRELLREIDKKGYTVRGADEI